MRRETLAGICRTQEGCAMEALGAGDPANLGPYTLLAQLGSGGMGTVYLARSPSGRTVAVKTVRPDLAGDSGFRERFRREVEAARSVSGFYTASVIDADLQARVPWVATVYVDAPDLAALVDERGPLPEPEVQALGAGLAEALAAIHRAGLVHRDLKPSNVLVTPDGPRIIDFGIARALTDGPVLTTLGAAIGTPGFMSPEQAQGLTVSAASDVFSLGALLYYAATGHAPFGTGTAHALLYRVVHDQPDLARVPPALRSVTAACLTKPAEQRPSPESLLPLLVPEAPSRLGPSLQTDHGRGGPPWWEQDTAAAQTAGSDFSPAARKPATPAADPGDSADIAWWSVGDLPTQASDLASSGFPVGQQALAAYRDRLQTRDRGPAPGPRVDGQLAPGDVVEHARFGIGTVLEIRDEEYALFAFGPHQTERVVSVRLAPMRRISRS